MLFLKALLVSVSVIEILSFSQVYAADNINLSYTVNPNQILAININEKVGKLSRDSSFAVTEYPEIGNINVKNTTLGIFEYSNKLDNTTDKVVITETDGNHIRKFNVNFEIGLTPLVANHNHRIGLGMLTATVIGTIVTLVVIHILHKSKSRFFDIIRGPNMDPSLSLFQFLVWTFVVIFSFILVYSIKILAGDYNLAGSTIPYNLLVLMGISTAVPILSTAISKAYYERDPTLENVVASAFESKNNEELKKLRKENSIGKMLKENNKPTLARYQMFAWTFIGIFIYLFSLSSLVASNDQPQEIKKISVPDVDITIVVLMGLASTAFLGLKAVSSHMTIREVYPLRVEAGNSLSIFGTNFGEESDTIWIGTTRINSTNQPNDLIWSDDRIDLKIPLEIQGYFPIRVVKKGSSVEYKDKIVILSPPRPPAP